MPKTTTAETLKALEKLIEATRADVKMLLDVVDSFEKRISDLEEPLLIKDGEMVISTGTTNVVPTHSEIAVSTQQPKQLDQLLDANGFDPDDPTP